ncbi:hypothetical protein CEXT_383661 [Caerostris extrusa]|uniref:Uncharacterized protein n=1 Tax=Caerostris extrusa TaxID=172846 RepID=A0AAV4MUI9_CAEEX|nr:hypothetical protein CEXT_383661 [Caerostris extrusa]
MKDDESILYRPSTIRFKLENKTREKNSPCMCVWWFFSLQFFVYILLQGGSSSRRWSPHPEQRPKGGREFTDRRIGSCQERGEHGPCPAIRVHLPRSLHTDNVLHS